MGRNTGVLAGERLENTWALSLPGVTALLLEGFGGCTGMGWIASLTGNFSSFFSDGLPVKKGWVGLGGPLGFVLAVAEFFMSFFLLSMI
jgi:hypothetical protein